MTMAHAKSRRIKTGLWLTLIITIPSLVGCYPATYRQVPVEEPSPRLRPVTQLYFYPRAGQSTEQQSRDHYECYNWAVKQTGFDPGQSSIPQRQRVKVVPMPPPGHDTAVLAVAGAVLGALIAGPRHAAGGAIVGAGTGAIAGAASDASRQQYSRSEERRV